MTIVPNRITTDLQYQQEMMPKVVGASPLGNDYERKNRGRKQRLDVSQPPVRLLDVVGDDQTAQHLTVHCSLMPVNGSLPGEPIELPRVVLLASWGTDGAAHSAEIDGVHGGSFSVAASSLRVDAIVEPQVGEGDYGPCFAALSVGYYPSPVRAQRTIWDVIIGDEAADSVTLRVPPFAKRCELLRIPGAAGASTGVRALWLGGGASWGEISTIEPINMAVPNGANRLECFNLSGAGLLKVVAVFELGI